MFDHRKYIRYASANKATTVSSCHHKWTKVGLLVTIPFVHRTSIQHSLGIEAGMGGASASGPVSTQHHNFDSHICCAAARLPRRGLFGCQHVPFLTWETTTIILPNSLIATSEPERCSSLSMLCQTCWLMLAGQQGRQWQGTYNLHFEHHRNVDSLLESAERDCNICRVLCEELAVAVRLDAWDNPDDTMGWIERLKARLFEKASAVDDPGHILSSALLSVMDGFSEDGNQESKPVALKCL